MNKAFKLRDALERMMWTFVVAALTNLGTSALLDIAVWKSAVASGVAAVLTFLLTLGRYRLSVLPDPGGAVRDGLVSDLRKVRNAQTRKARAAKKAK